MQKLFFISAIVFLQACKTTTPTTGSSVVDAFEQKTTMIETSKTTLECEAIANAVKPMVSLKWKNREAVKQDSSKVVADEQLLSQINNTAFKQIGYSKKATVKVAKEVLSTDISNEMEYDMLSYHNFYKAQCELTNEDKTVLPLVDVAPMLDKCWFPVHNKGVDPEVCFKQVLAGELTL